MPPKKKTTLPKTTTKSKPVKKEAKTTSKPAKKLSEAGVRKFIKNELEYPDLF